MKNLDPFQEMLAFIFESSCGFSKGMATRRASYFVGLPEFLDLDFSRAVFRSISGRRLPKLKEHQIEAVGNFQVSGILDRDKSILDNYLTVLCLDFTQRQLDSIGSLDLDRLSPNPFLVYALNFTTPEALLHVNVYMFAGRSIVTSMGFFVERLLLISSDDVYKVETGWDIKKVNNNHTSWLQIKSGTNDMDRDQIEKWVGKITAKINQGDDAYIGITYGKETDETVSLGILRQLLPNWKMRTLIGRDLWEFISGDPNYVDKVFDNLRGAAANILKGHSIADEINIAIDRLTKEFVGKYGDGSEGINNFINDRF